MTPYEREMVKIERRRNALLTCQVVGHKWRTDSRAPSAPGPQGLHPKFCVRCGLERHYGARRKSLR